MHSSEDIIGQELHAKGWCCGATIPAEMYSAVIEHCRQSNGVDFIDDRDWLVVLSQTCDVVARRLDQEPLIELLHCRPIPKRGQFANRTSTRQLDFRPDKDKLPTFYLTAHASRDRYFIPRTMLIRCEPQADRRLSDNAVRGLQAWYALRYTRPAWPNEFVELLNPFKVELEAALSTLPADDESELRITVPKQGSGKYRIGIYLVIDEELAKNQSYRQTAQAAFATFISTLRRSAKIELDDSSDVVSGANFSWQQMQMTDVWNFAFLTPIDR